MPSSVSPSPPLPLSPSARFRHIAQLGLQAAAALACAHDRGIIHRDIKPANLLLDDAGKLWITDFGLAHIEGAENLTMSGDLLGTLRYMSPEQALGPSTTIDHRTDIYSLGATLYELLTGQPVVNARDRIQVLRQLTDQDPTPPRKLNRAIPFDLETILLKSLTNSPTDRYLTAGDFAADLQRFLDSKPIAASILLALAAGAVGNALRGVPRAAQASRLLETPPNPSAQPSTSYAVPGTSPTSATDVTNPKSKIPNPKSLPSLAPIPPPPGLIAWWSGDGNANDLMASHHGSPLNGTTFAPGLVGDAFLLDGVDDYIRIPHHPELNPVSGFTIECWICSAETKGPRVIVSKWDTITNDFVYMFKDHDRNDKLRFELRGLSSIDIVDLTALSSIVVEEWVHAAAAFDTQTARIYFNGSYDGVALVPPGLNVACSSDLLIGAQGGTNNRQHFSGLIDEIALYDRALSDVEIQSIFAARALGKSKPVQNAPLGIRSANHSQPR